MPRLSRGDDVVAKRLFWSWATAWVLAGCYVTSWVELRLSDVGGPIAELAGSTGAQPHFLLGASSVVRAGPFDMHVLGLPLWMGLLAALTTAILRTLISGRHAIDGRIPVALSAFGFVLMLATALNFAADGQLSSLCLGFGIAFFAHAWTAVAEFSYYRSSRSR